MDFTVLADHEVKLKEREEKVNTLILERIW